MFFRDRIRTPQDPSAKQVGLSPQLRRLHRPIVHRRPECALSSVPVLQPATRPRAANKPDKLASLHGHPNPKETVSYRLNRMPDRLKTASRLSQHEMLVDVRVGVKRRNTRCEQMYSALPPKA